MIRLYPWAQLRKRKVRLGLLLFCLILSAYLSIDLLEGVTDGLKAGQASLTWPSVQGFASHPSLRARRHRFLPDTHTVFLPYIYRVEDKQYNGASFDVAGIFSGNLAEANKFRKNFVGEVTIYYNPADPAEAVMSPGIEFDFHTRSLFRVVGVALAVALLSLVEFRFFGKLAVDNSGELTETQ